jgi:hypothetical protein
MGRCRCPNDGGLIPEVGQCRAGMAPLIHFYWCKYCEELFAFVGDRESGSRFAASFSWHQGSGQWRVWKAGASEADVQSAVEAVVQMERSG